MIERRIQMEKQYKFDKEELERRAKDWYRLLEQASDELITSKPLLSDADLHYIADLLNKNTRMKWLMPLIIEGAIDEGEIEEELNNV